MVFRVKHLLLNREGGIFVQLSLYVITYSYSFSSVATSIVPSAIVPILCVFAIYLCFCSPVLKLSVCLHSGIHPTAQAKTAKASHPGD